MLHNLIKRLGARLRFSRDIRKLRGLDDRALEDMGIAREHIAARVRGEC